MTTNSESDTTRLGTWLPVTKEGAAYVEIERDKTTCRFELISDVVELELAKHKVRRWINLDSADWEFRILGQTRHSVGVIGVSNEYPIFDVRIAPHDGPSTATITKVMSHTGHQFRASLEICLPRAVVARIVDALETARYPQQIVVSFPPNSFYSGTGDRQLDGDIGRVYYLPWVKDLPIQTQTDGHVVATPPLARSLR